MKSKTAHAIYDVITAYAEAPESLRDDFVISHVNSNTREFRFCGNLGFGGKYWAEKGIVNCYMEDITPERTEIIRETNAAIALILNPPPRAR